MTKVLPYAKAVAGFAVPVVVALAAAVQDGTPGGSSITGGEWIAAGAAGVLTAAGVYTVPNRRAKADA